MNLTWRDTPARFMIENGHYRKANEFLKMNGIKEYRTDPLMPYGPDENHVYWIHRYYPKNLRGDKTSDKIRELKNGSDEAAYDFGMEILGVIKMLSETSGREEFHLVCIPPHLSDRGSMVNRCIDCAISLNDDPDLKLFKNTIVMKRITDVSPSHIARPPKEDHDNSIFIYSTLSDMQSKNVILLDDVTTTGGQMNTAREKILSLGIRKERLFQLAIGKTGLP